MKKLVTLITAACVCACSLGALAGCGDKKDTASVGAQKRMTVDINPSVEFLLDADNKVVSVSALNDDGNVIIYGEAFVGKTAEEAAQLVVSVATETGYLAKGEVKLDTNEIKISISGDSGEAEKLYTKVSDKVNTWLDKNGVKAGIEKTQALALDELKKLAGKYTSYTDEEIDKMDEKQIISALSLERIKTAEVYSEELKQIYSKAKAYELAFAESEETAKIIAAMGDAYKSAYDAYDKLLASMQTAIDELEKARFNAIISEDSSYVKSLKELRAAKEDLLQKREAVANIKAGESEITLKAQLALSEKSYNLLLSAFETLGSSIDAGFSIAIGAVKTAQTALTDAKANFPTEITTKLNESAKDIENKLNETKDSFFAAFETAHKDDIDKCNAEVKAYKDQLKKNIEAA